MPSYMLDTNVCVLLLRGKPEIRSRLAAVGVANCFISEITVAELSFGAEKSGSQLEVQRTQGFMASAQVLPITSVPLTYARQRWRLQQIGQPLDDFDLLIGSTALSNNLVMVTNNTRHFARLPLQLEDWTHPQLPNLPAYVNVA